MSDVIIEGGLTQDNAILLLAAAEELGEPADVVRTTLHGFVVPKKVAEAAGLNGYDPHADFNAEVEEASKAAEADKEPHDFAAPVPAAPPTINDEGELVEEERVDTDPVPIVASPVVDTTPKASDNKAAWAKYAESQGETDDSLTKAELIEKYGTKE